MRLKPLACVSVLTGGDYLLWNWSAGGAHDILALISGLTLLPLAAVCFGLLVLTSLQVVTRSVRRSATMTRSVRAPRDINAAEHSPGDSESRSTSHRLAA